MSGTRTFFREELPLYPKVPIAAWLGIIAFPALTIWATVTDGFEVGGAIALLLLWLGSVALLRWHLKAKSRWEQRHGVNAPTPWND